MSRRVLKAALAAGTAVSLSLALAGVARAVSGGGYQPSQQDCSPAAEQNSAPQGSTEQGCHNLAVNVESGSTRYAELGLDQQPQDQNSPGTPTPLSIGYPGGSASPHSGCVAVNTDGTGGGEGTGCGNNSSGAGGSASFDYYAVYCPIVAALGSPCEDQSFPSSPVTPSLDQGSATSLDSILSNGLLFYFGSDDNLDNGEHDGVPPTDNTCPKNSKKDPGCLPSDTGGTVNGPSDGGAIQVAVTPQSAARTPSLTHPEGLANASEGSCADGICQEATTQQQTVYQGCGANQDVTPKQGCTNQNANVYDYGNDPSVNSEPVNCNSGGPDTQNNQACNGPMDNYRQSTASNWNAEPGVQTYADPDPQRSPADPSIWPTPGLYAGTCGVSVNPGFIGNDAGTGDSTLVAVPTGC